MADFSIEDEKASIKTKPSYPGCCCEQPASPCSPCTKRVHNSQEAGGWRLHRRNWPYSLRGKMGTRRTAGRTWGGGAAGFPLLTSLLRHKAACTVLASLNLLAARTHQLEVRRGNPLLVGSIVGGMCAQGGTRPALNCCMGKGD